MSSLLTDPKYLLTILKFEQTSGTPISAIYKEEPEHTIGFLGNFSVEFIQMLNTRFEVQPSQASFIANALVNNYPNLTTKGYALFLNRFAMGKYGTFYGSFDIMKFFESLSIFYSEFEDYWKKKNPKPPEYPTMAEIKQQALEVLGEKSEMSLRAQGYQHFVWNLGQYGVTVEEYRDYKYTDPNRRPPLGIENIFEYEKELKKIGYTGNERRRL